jgi:GT2 family glycosyltransferase
LTVVIVNYNSWPDVRRLVATLAATTEVGAGDAEVVVVDNDSTGPIPTEFLAAGTGARSTSGVRLVVRDDNGGFAAGVNDGWRAARGPWLLVLNPDVVVSDRWLGEVVARVRRFESDPATAPGIVGFGLINPDGSRQPSVGAFPSLARTLWEQLIPRPRRKYQADWRTRPGPVSWVTGACVLVNTRLLAVLGGMDEDFFLYYEEVALCRAAHRRGWRVEFDPSVAVTHLCPLQNRALSPKMRVITRHSKLLYFRKHLPPWQFHGLSWIVTLEATIRGKWSSFTRRAEDARSWRTIRAVARDFRAGNVLRGPDVRTLAESVLRPSPPSPSGTQPTPSRGIGSAGKRRGARARTARLLQPRKDGPACR